MSMRLRMPFALLAALVMVLFSTGAALADSDDATETTGSTDTATETETETETSESLIDSLAGLTTSGSAKTDGVSPLSVTTTGSLPDSISLPTTLPNTGSNTNTSTNTNGSTTSSSANPSETPPQCVARVVQQLITDLQGSLEANGAELEAAITAALGTPPNPANLVTALPVLLGEQGADLSTEGELILTKAGQELQKCLPTPPAGGSQTTGPRPSQASGQYTPPAQQSFTYRNCDEARASGAAPVYAGQYGYGTHLDSDYDGIGCEEQQGTYAPVAQPVAYASDGGKLAYTGVSVQPLIAWGTALALAGGWLILSGRRRV